MKTTLTRTECQVMRGIAILGIVLHNYCHWLNGIVRENEYLFHSNNVDGFWRAISQPDANLLMHVFSFFGHYGVPVFLFLSAYGLTKKYEMKPNDDTHLKFISSHFRKLFRMMFVGFVAFLFIDNITPGRHRYAFIDVIAQLGLFNNLLPHPEKIIWPGPYWFFGLMMQLCIVWRLLLYKRHWGVTVGLMLVCTLLQMLCLPESEELNRLRYNCIGGMLPFGFGVLYARYFDDVQLSRAHALCVFGLSVVLILMCSNAYLTWYLVPLLVCIATVAVVKALPSSWLSPLVWVGNISAALFVCHPITRKVFITISRHGDPYTGLLIYLIASLALAWLFRELLRRIPK